MTEFSYNRKYTLQVTQSRTQSVEYSRENPNTTPPTIAGLVLLETGTSIYSAEETYRTIKTDTITLTDLHFTFSYTSDNKTEGSKGGTASIKIYNLTQETRNKISRQNGTVNLQAGYEQDGNNLPLVFNGQIVQAYTSKEGQDVITTLHCKEGATPINDARVAARVERGGTYSDVFELLASYWNANGVATGKLVLDIPGRLDPVLESPPAQSPLIKGWTFQGKLRQAMDEVCKQFNYSWQIVNNELYVHPKRYAEMIGVVTINTSNILSIEDKQEGGRLPSSKEEDKGLTIKILLDGRITRHHRIVVADGRKSGTYSVTSVSHQLSYEGNEWYTIIECEKRNV